MSDNDHAAAIKRIVTLHVRNKTIGDRSASAINHHADALARDLAEAEARADRWKQRASERRESYMAMLQQRDEAEARAARLRAWACAEDELATALIALLTDAQIARPDYPDELERQASIAHTACWQAGDVEDSA